MIRFVKQDFERLQAYLENYGLSADLGAKAREELLKRAHKSSLAMLQAWGATEGLAAENALLLKGRLVLPTSSHFNQIAEYFSDIVSALFASMHGLYKPAHMSLRSAIETFVRGVAGPFSTEAETTTSVYRLFEIAGNQTPFLGASNAFFIKLHEHYSELCLFTHSATPAHMARNYALATFPKHDTLQMKVFVRHFESIVAASLSALVLANPNVYLNIPPLAREVLDEVLPTPVKISALGGSSS
jgi:hypothetical protein